MSHFSSSLHLCFISAHIPAPTETGNSGKGGAVYWVAPIGSTWPLPIKEVGTRSAIVCCLPTLWLPKVHCVHVYTCYVLAYLNTLKAPWGHVCRWQNARSTAGVMMRQGHVCGMRAHTEVGLISRHAALCCACVSVIIQNTPSLCLPTLSRHFIKTGHTALTSDQTIAALKDAVRS